jgi:hypothetical protein
MTTDWNERLLEQLIFHWDHQLRPGLEGLTDEEYLWEPAPGCWSLRPAGDGWTADIAFPPPMPAPLTTIAWRLARVIVGVFGARNASHFGGPAADYATWSYAGDAATALAQLDATYADWVAGVRGLGVDGLEREIGPAEGEWARFSYAELVLHIHREVLHHGAEVLLLRDLYRARS